MKPYMSTESHMERANSRAFSPVPFAAEPKAAPSMRYTGFLIGISCRRESHIQKELLENRLKNCKTKGKPKVFIQNFQLDNFHPKQKKNISYFDI